MHPHTARVSLLQVRMPRVTLTGAVLTGAFMKENVLIDCDCKGADFSGARYLAFVNNNNKAAAQG